MLHAEIHHKLSPDAENGQRSEDVLTSTVFGTLLAAGAVDVLRGWLSRARRNQVSIPGIAVAAHDVDYWFWPTLARTEPDLLLRLGTTLVIVEAKYRSRKSSTDSDPDPATSDDQLVRQWRVCRPEADMAGYPRDVRDALQAPGRARVLVYLVMRKHRRRAQDELDESLAIAPGASMFLLTWEDLDAELAMQPEKAWTRDLRAYLRVREVSAFRGFKTLPLAASARTLDAWARARTPASLGFARALAGRLGFLPRLASRPTRFPEPTS